MSPLTLLLHKSLPTTSLPHTSLCSYHLGIILLYGPLPLYVLLSHSGSLRPSTRLQFSIHVRPSMALYPTTALFSLYGPLPPLRSSFPSTALYPHYDPLSPLRPSVPLSALQPYVLSTAIFPLRLSVVSTALSPLYGPCPIYGLRPLYGLLPLLRPSVPSTAFSPPRPSAHTTALCFCCLCVSLPS